jgi:hypothetical protein
MLFETMYLLFAGSSGVFLELYSICAGWFLLVSYFLIVFLIIVTYVARKFYYVEHYLETLAMAIPILILGIFVLPFMSIGYASHHLAKNDEGIRSEGLHSLYFLIGLLWLGSGIVHQWF